MQPSELTQFIARCNPSTPAKGADYVERTPPITPRLRAQISPSKASRVLLLGQTGVGKSTELIQLEQQIANEFCVLRPPLDDALDLRNLTWHEILLFTAVWASENPIIRSQIATELTTFDLGAALRTERMTGGPPPPTPIQRFRNDPAAMRMLIESGRAQFWDLAEAMLKTIESRSGKEILLLFDGLEKLTDVAAEKLFYDEGRFLDQLPCRAVITAPLSLSFQYFYGNIEEHFPYPAERLRAFSCQPAEPGFAFFRRLAERRGASAWMSQDTLDNAVMWGGGLPRQFLQLLASAGSQAVAEGTRIEEETLIHAVIRLVDKWKYQLGPEDYAEIQKQDAKRSTSARSRLLRLGALIEYDQPDGSLRLAINPLVETLIESRTKDTRGASNG